MKLQEEPADSPRLEVGEPQKCHCVPHYFVLTHITNRRNSDCPDRPWTISPFKFLDFWWNVGETLRNQTKVPLLEQIRGHEARVQVASDKYVVRPNRRHRMFPHICSKLFLV